MATKKVGAQPRRLKIRVSSHSDEPGSAQVARQLRELIGSGSLKAGDALPSEDGLAEQLGVGRKIVRYAYGKLVHEGLLVTDFPRNKRVAGKGNTQAKRGVASPSTKGAKTATRDGKKVKTTKKVGRK
jgi:DNA-binding GntR family transcriptional regulator